MREELNSYIYYTEERKIEYKKKGTELPVASRFFSDAVAHPSGS
jgi:hypothetical protein